NSTSAPVETTNSMTTNDADIRVCAYWRSSSVSKAGRVPLDDVNRSRASRTRCAAARRAFGDAAGGGGAGSRLMPLTGRAPRGPAAPPRAARSATRRGQVQPEAGQLQAFQRVYS